MLTADDVAQYFLSKQEEDCGDLISNIRPQKLLYYAQGFSLALLDRPLFAESVYAWGHGPVVRAIYHEYKPYGAGALPVPQALDFSIYTSEERELMDEVYDVYGQYSAWKLRDLTHEEPPWRDTPADEEITHERMRDYFKTQVYA